MITMSDVENPNSIIAWWNDRANQKAPYLYQSLFTNSRVDSDMVSLITGADQAMRSLSLAADDTHAIRLDNQGFSSEAYKLASFKNYKLMDEKRRNDIKNFVANNADEAAITALTNTQYQDPAELLNFALYTREKMAMQALTTGKIAIQSDQIAFTADFHMPADHVKTVATAWGNEDSQPLADLIDAVTQMNDDNGTVIAYAVVNSKTLRKISRSGEVINSLSVGKTSTNVAISIPAVKELIQATTGVQVLVYDKGDVDGRFIPDDEVILIAAGSLGRMAWTDTNEALGLTGFAGAQMSTTSEGITVVTSRELDPVGTRVKVSQKVLPAFDKVQNVYVMNVAGASKASAPQDLNASATSDGANVSAKK